MFAFLFPLVFFISSIPQQAVDAGFFYRNSSCSVEKSCKKAHFSHKTKDGFLCCKRHDKTEVSVVFDKDDAVLNITPDPLYSSYYLYVQREAFVTKARLTKREVRISGGRGASVLQLVGVGAKGPIVLYQRNFKPFSAPFKNNLLQSINLLRRKNRLQPFSLFSMEKHEIRGLHHYDGDRGSLRHQGMRSQNVGENLFRARSFERAFHLLVSSPSHLYNLMNPRFTKVAISTEKRDGLIHGVMLFRN